MKKQLNKADILELLADESLNCTITRTKKDFTKVMFTPKQLECFGCSRKYNIESLEIRLDARVTTLTLPKKFCKPCSIIVDDILSRLKTQATPNWLKLTK